MPRYLIHVGPHKTGTTYLQITMRNLRERLEENGILFRLDWGVSDDVPSHHRLFQRLLTHKDPDPELEQQFRDLNRSDYELIVISSEDMSNLSPPAINYLRSLLQGAEVEIVFYCRRWADLIASGWQELVKHGHSQTLLEMANAALANPYASTINFANTLDKYAAIFGKERVRLVSYDVLAAEGQDLVEHFFNMFLHCPINALLPPGQVHKPSRVNVSLNPSDTEIIRALNAIEHARSGQRSAAIRTEYIKAKPRLDLTEIVAATEQHLRMIRIDEEVAVLRNLHENIFRRYAECVVPPKLSTGLFPPGVAEINYVHPDYLLRPGISDALLGIYQKLFR